MDQTTQGLVALKLFPPTPISAIEFRREAAIWVRSDHPNLISLVDAGVWEQQPYLALELVEGISLRTWLARGSGEPERVLAVLAQVFAGLDALHRAGVAHGDIKPDNLLLQGERLRIIDFGRARLHHVLPEMSGMFPGTPAYMHPRLYRGGAPDAASDCFAAWVTGYELLMGRRPFGMQALQWAEADDLAQFAPLSNARLQRLVYAGITGALADARGSWLAIQRFLRGRDDLPRPLAPPPEPEPGRVQELLALAWQGRSTALVGDPQVTRPHLEALDRAWRAGGGYTLWVERLWAAEDRPLSAALALARNAGDALDTTQLQQIDRDLGPLGSALAAVEPAVRTWVSAPPSAEPGRRPEPERLALAMSRLLEAAPRPLLVLVSGLGQIDGASRRFFGRLVVSGRLTLVGDALPDAPHGLPVQIPLSSSAPPHDLGARVSEGVAILAGRSAATQLPFGPLLARASGLGDAEVQDAALEAEAAGLARWTGAEVVALPRLDPRSKAWCAEAARRLSAEQDPFLVARLARRGEDGERLAEVLDQAIAQAIRLDPTEALELIQADPRPPTAPRVLRNFRVAMLARDMAEAEAALGRLRALPDVAPEDLAEVEGELAFRRGEYRPALDGFNRAVAALGAPVHTGWRRAWDEVVAIASALLGRPPTPRPNPRIARLYDHLYDLYFCVDHRFLIGVHRTWLAAAPQDPRARMLQMIWYVVFNQRARARAAEAELFASIREDQDPVGAAVVLLHRGIARSLSGETAQAYADGVDAAERLLRVGDPYYAALATTLPSVCAVHLGRVEPLARLNQALEALVQLTGDDRAAAWARGNDAVIRWSRGDLAGAIDHTRHWADESATLQDANEAFARRFLADLLLEQGRWEDAMTELERCEVVTRRARLQLDYVEARWITRLIADAMARAAGKPGVRLGPASFRTRLLLRTSPRWTPRILAAQGWQRAVRGDTAGAGERFSAAYADALAREQVQDAWWVLMQQGRALRDLEALERADALAREAQIKMDGT